MCHCTAENYNGASCERWACEETGETGAKTRGRDDLDDEASHQTFAWLARIGLPGPAMSELERPRHDRSSPGCAPAYRFNGQNKRLQSLKTDSCCLTRHSKHEIVKYMAPGTFSLFPMDPHTF